METFEINIWSFLVNLYRNKFIILCFLLLFTVTSFLVSEFYIVKKYETQAWIQPVDFLRGEGKVPLDVIRTYFTSPEVIQALVQQDVLKQSNPDKQIRLDESNGTVKIVYTHPSLPNATQILERWVLTTQFKYILDHSEQIVSILEEDITSLQFNITLSEKKLKQMEKLLAQEGKYSQTEVIPKESGLLQKLVLNELNPNYTELNGEVNLLRVEIDDFKNKKIMVEQILDDYRDLLKEIGVNFESGQLSSTNVLKSLKNVQARYISYMNSEEDSPKYISLIPFQTLTMPVTSLSHVSPNIQLNVILAGFLGLILGIFVSIFKEYIKELKTNENMETV